MTIEPDAPKAEFRVRSACPVDKDAILELLERSFRVQQDPNRWEWLFLRNTANTRMHYLVADAGERLAGQYALMPARLQHDGRSLLGLLSLDTATDPDFERRGIFTSLARQAYAEAASEAPIVYGFPNPNSAPALYGKLGWVELRPFPLFVRPLGHTRAPVAALRPRLLRLAQLVDAIAILGVLPARGTKRWGERAGGRVVNLEGFGPWADELWEELRSEFGTCAVRDASFLQWRFVEGPRHYRLYGLDRGSGPTGFAAISYRAWQGGKVADLMELMVPRGDRAGASLLLATAVLDAWSRGAIALKAIVTPRHPHRAAFLKAGFFRPPTSLTGGASFGARILDPSQVTANALLHIEDWYISGADLDYI